MIANHICPGYERARDLRGRWIETAPVRRNTIVLPSFIHELPLQTVRVRTA
jgi:hypothetical protein